MELQLFIFRLPPEGKKNSQVYPHKKKSKQFIGVPPLPDNFYWNSSVILIKQLLYIITTILTLEFIPFLDTE